MLVLGRRERQRVTINPGTPEQVIIEVCKIKGDMIRIGFIAHPSVRIVRNELLADGEDARVGAH
jgi:sRNA-binding carbon storage regulator CsrA